MSILQFCIIIGDIIIFSGFNLGSGMIFIIIDDIGILTVAILFLLSFIFYQGNKINGCVRSAVTVVVWFVGFTFRGIANMSMPDVIDIGALFGVMAIRTLILFFSIPVSFLNAKNVVSPAPILASPSPVPPM